MKRTTFGLCALVMVYTHAPVLAEDAALAEALVKHAGVHRGLCAVLGADGNLAVELSRSSGWLVHVRDPRSDRIRDLRKRTAELGLGLDRFAAEEGTLGLLPHADNLVDVVLITDGVPGERLSVGEVLRALRPGGVAIVGQRGAAGDKVDPATAQLTEWAASQRTGDVETWHDATGAWLKIVKPPLQGADDWSHWEHGPDNNPVSTDKVIRAPYMTQFMAHPHNIGMPSVTTAAAGRTFLAIGHISHHRREWGTLQRLIARNGYNGIILWERELPPGYLVHRSAFIATAKTFFMMNGDHCLMLDPATGTLQGKITVPNVTGEWKWMVLQDGVLYFMAGKKDAGTKIVRGDRAFGGWSWADLSPGYYGKRIPFGFGDTVTAYDVAAKKTLWSHKETSLIDSRGMALSEGRLYFYCPDKHLRALDAKTGEPLWTNAEPKVRELIEKPGRGLTSTPGFRTACLMVATPKALIIQGQTRMHVIGASTADGSLLWAKKKVTNNPNAIFVDGKVILGVGERGEHVVLDPVSGDVVEKLGFMKRACTRLTASPDSFFCRGEGTLRFDRHYKEAHIDGAARPACNDGAIATGGVLYMGPWQCDCNLSLTGCIAKCSAGDFQFHQVATEEDNLRRVAPADTAIASFATDKSDWATYRGDHHRSGGTDVSVPGSVSTKWRFRPAVAAVPSAATAAGDLIFTCGDDGIVRALDATGGQVRWQFATPLPVKYPPTIWEGRAYVGCSDGRVYALEAATGRLLWKFRAAPLDRHVMIYGKLSSTWPVNSGVLVKDGVAYFAAGIIDYDGTYVYALDARTGAIRWQNDSSGHLSEKLRKGVSVQGTMTLQGDQLMMAGGNQVSPAIYNIKSGKCLSASFQQGHPKANNGRFVGVFRNEHTILGGKILFAPPENVSTKGSFVTITKGRGANLNFGGVPPAWNQHSLALVNFKFGKLMCCDAAKVSERMKKGFPENQRGRGRRRWLATLSETFRADNAVRWESNLGEAKGFEVISLAMADNAVVAVLRHQHRFRSQPQWYCVAFDVKKGTPLFQRELRGRPLPGGLLIDRRGQIVISFLDGEIEALGG